MANSDVKVREIRLLESYSQAYNRFMDSTIHLMYRFCDFFDKKYFEARYLEHKIKDHLNIAKQQLEHAKTAYEYTLNRDIKDGGNELRHRKQALEKYKALYKKAQNYTESAKKIKQNIQGETEGARRMTLRQLNKLKNSRGEGNDFLKKAIAALNEYRQ